MRLFLVLLACVGLFSTGCNTPAALFASKTRHQQYAAKLSNAGLHETAAGKAWLAAAETSLTRPLSITLPYQETGYFEATAPRAIAYRFAGRRGELMDVRITKKPGSGFSLFADVWMLKNGGANRPLASADSTLTLQTELTEDAQYILRLQPELLAGGEYTLAIKTLPSLGALVPAQNNPRIISLWGVDRDGGARRHEGIDIAAGKRVPLLAGANGLISSTRENNLGGKVVFLQPEGKNYSLYYAHLDAHMVQQGQRVRKGDTIGLMGNTGNAKYTVPHLHFGIYTTAGAVDPLPFVQTERPALPAVTAPLNRLTELVKTNAGTALLLAPQSGAERSLQLPPQTWLKVLAASKTYFQVTTADGQYMGFVAAGLVESVATGPERKRTAAPLRLLDAPRADAAVKTTVPANALVQRLARYGQYAYLSIGDVQGWAADF